MGPKSKLFDLTLSAILEVQNRAVHGQVVLTQPSRMQLKEDGRYVLSGGVGALGLAAWMWQRRLCGMEPEQNG